MSDCVARPRYAGASPRPPKGGDGRPGERSRAALCSPHWLSRPRSLDERLSGELLGLTRGCDLRKEGVTVTSQANNPNKSDYRCLSLGLSHLTVIIVHILLDHLLSSVLEMIIKKISEVVNENFSGSSTC